MEDHSRGCRAIPRYCKFQSHAPHHVDTGTRDPTKEWLQLHYCISGEDVEMEMHDWKDDWKIPVIAKEVPTGKEVEVGGSKTPVGDSVAPKK
jgi:hypothetical protein